MPVSFIGKKLLFITAHPDDESYIFAGTLLLNHKQGGQNYIICATCGEKGKSHLDKPISQKQLASLRKKELIAVSKYLKVKKLHCLNAPDCATSDCKNLLSEKIQKIISVCKPDYILGFGPDGVTGHLDHITLGIVAKKAAKKAKIPHLIFQGPPSLIKDSKWINHRKKHGKYSNKITHRKPNISIRINPKLKLKALRFHKSQLETGNPFPKMPKGVAMEMLSYEYFFDESIV